MTKTTAASREFQMSTTRLVKQRLSSINITMGFIQFHTIVCGSRWQRNTP